MSIRLCNTLLGTYGTVQKFYKKARLRAFLKILNKNQRPKDLRTEPSPKVTDLRCLVTQDVTGVVEHISFIITRAWGLFILERRTRGRS